MWRVPLLITSVMLIIGLMGITPESRVDTAFEIYFEDDDPDLVAYQTITEEFSREANVVLLLRNRDRSELGVSTYEAAQKLTEIALHDPDVERVGSPTEFEILLTEGTDLITQRVIPDSGPWDATEVSNILRNDPDALGRVISRDATILAISARFYSKPEGTEGLVAASERYRSVAAQLEQQFPEIQILVSGLIPLEATLYEIMVADSLVLVPILSVIVVVAMGFLVGTAVGVIATLLVAGLSALCCLMVIPIMGFAFNDVNVAAILVVITIASADCIHVLMRYFVENRTRTKGVSKKEAVVHALEHVLAPISLTTITTMIGFALFWFAESPPIKQFGLVSAIGVGFALMFTVSVFVPFLSFFPPRRDSVPNIHGAIAATLFWIESRLQSPVMWRAAIVLCCSVGIFAFFNTIDDDIVEYVSEKTEVREAVIISEGQLHGMQFLDIVIRAPKGTLVLSPDITNSSEALVDWLHEHDAVTGVDSLVSQLRRVQAAIDGRDVTDVTLPNTERGLSELLFLLEIVSKPGALESTVNFVRTETKIRVFVGDETASGLLALDTQIKEHAQIVGLTDVADVATTGPTLMFAFLGTKNIVSVLYGTFVFLAVVTIILGLALRSAKLALLSIVPNIFPILLVFGVWYFVNGSLNLAGVTTITAILGLIVDDTIHIMWNYVKSRKSTRATNEALFINLAPALTTTSICFTLGFATLVFSSFAPTQTMGLLVALTIASAYFFDLIMLPRLLKLTDQERTKIV